MLTLTRLWSESSESGFAFRAALLGIATVAVPLMLATLGLREPFDLVVPLSGALILGAAYTRRPVEALLVLALVVLIYDTIAYYSVGSFKRLDELSVGLIVIIAFIRAVPTWRAWFWWPRELAFAVVIGSAIASTLVAQVPVSIWVPALLLVGKPVGYLYAVMWTPFRKWEIRGAFGFVLAIGLVILALGLIELVAPAAFEAVFGLPTYQPRGPLPVVKSIFIRPGVFGFFTTYVALFLFAAFIVTRRWLWLGLALAFSLGPLLSARRRAILALGAGLVVAFANTLRTRPRPAAVLRTWGPIGGGVGLMFAAFMPLLVGLYDLTIERYVPGGSPPPGVVDGEVPEGEIDDDPQARVALYIGSVEVAWDRAPLGGGLGRYASVIARNEYSPLYYEYGLSDVHGLRPNNPIYATDTFWPQILGEFGAIGLAAYVAFFTSLGYRLWRAARAEDQPYLRIVRLGAGMVFAQAIVESVANAMFHSPPRVYLVFLAVGVVLSLAWRADASLVRAEGSGRRSREGDH